MQLIKTVVAVAAVAGSAVAASQSICDKYTVALLKDNTAANQLTLLTLLVNTVVIGNFTGKGTKQSTLPGSLVTVPGILAAGTYKGTKVNLAPYFTGELVSTNSGSMAVSTNWLDGGGATPILAKPTSSGTSGSNQATLLMHLYQFFGALLGCSMMGTSAFPSYEGNPNMAAVHQYMDISEAEMGYFVTQVGLAAQSFGASTADIATVGKALLTTFGERCSAPAKVVGTKAYPQAVCQASDCPMASPASCSAYAKVAAPATASSSAAASGSASAASASSSSGARATMVPVAAAGLAGLAAFAL